MRTIVYLGGLGDERDDLSAHLRSRHEVGDVLRESGVRVVELRAALIIGSGSISFEMMRYLTERLPVMIAPRWVMTRCQPIGIRDVLAYLIAALELPGTASKIYEIGGSDVLTYREMMLRYAGIRGLRRRIVVVPFFTPQLSSYWVHIVTPISARLAQPLIRGLHNEVVVRDGAAARDFPQIAPIGFDEAVRRALDRYRATGAETTWFDAFDLRSVPADFTGVKEGMLIDMRVRHAGVAPERLAAVFDSLGGRRGWLVADSLWRLRGWLDRAVGGVGLRRGRRSASDLRAGDAVDFLARREARAGEAPAVARRDEASRLCLAAVRGRAGRNGLDVAPNRLLRAPRTLRLPLLVRRGASPRMGLRHDGEPDRPGGREGLKASGRRAEGSLTAGARLRVPLG